MKTLLVLAALCCGLAPLPDARMNAVRTALRSTVALYGQHWNDDGSLQRGIMCTGWIYHVDRMTVTIATARHCITEVELTSVEFYDGERERILDKRVSNVADVGLLTVAQMLPHVALSTTREVEVGEQLLVVGMGSGTPWQFASAYSRDGETLIHGGYLGIECGSCYYGNSGSAIVNLSGEVIGTLDAGGNESYPGIVFAAPSIQTDALFWMTY